MLTTWTPGLRQLHDHHHANLRHRNDLDDLAAAVNTGNETVFAALLERCHHGDEPAGIASLYGLANRIVGVAVGTHRHRRVDLDSVIDAHLPIAWLVLTDLDPTETRLIARFQSRLWRRYARTVAHERSTRQMRTVPLDHDPAPAGDHDPTVTRALDRLELQRVAAHARQQLANGTITPTAWRTLIDCRIHGTPIAAHTHPGITPSGVRSRLHRTTSQLRSALAVDAA